MSVTDVEDKQAVMAAKVAKLLEKAESTTPEEAEALLDAATRLMTKYSLDRMLIDDLRGSARIGPEPIVQIKLDCKGSYHHAWKQLAVDLGYALECRPILGQRYEGSKKIVQVYLVGAESDVAQAELLFASLSIQAQRAMGSWVQSNPDLFRGQSGMTKFKMKREFLISFAVAACSQVRLAKKATETDYVKEHASSGVTSDSLSLAVKDKRSRTQDFIDETYGRLGRSRGGRLSGGGGGSGTAGASAGARADVGRPGVGGARGAIGSGR
jgi:hypothetical protein